LKNSPKGDGEMGAKRNETATAWCFRGYPLLLLMGFFLFLTSCGGGGVASFSVNVSLNGNGTVTSNPAGINCTTGNQGTCQKTFRQGTQVTLTASPATGWQFGSWQGCDSVNGNQCTLKMSANKTCTATFNISWAKTYGGAGYDYATSIQQTTDGGYIVAGFTDSLGAGEDDFWVLKLDARGDVVWQKTYGGGGWDEASSIQQTTDGGYIVAGFTYSFRARLNDGWVLKLDRNGDVANCTPANLVQNSNGTSTSTSIRPSTSGITPAAPSATVTNTNVAGQDSAATIATQCTG
jgi:hypothetical protein